MNNVGRINGNYNKIGGESARRGSVSRAAAPAWLVMICKFILWLTKDDVAGVLRASVGIGAVTLLALVAGAIGTGVVPFIQGGVICVCLAAMALIATRE